MKINITDRKMYLKRFHIIRVNKFENRENTVGFIHLLSQEESYHDVFNVPEPWRDNYVSLNKTDVSLGVILIQSILRLVRKF